MSNVSILYESLIEEKPLVEGRKNGDGADEWYIKGVFAMGEKKNNNGRIYPWKVIEKSCEDYIKEFVSTMRSIGCLDHPKTPETDTARASHIITKMWPNKERNVYEGEAVVLDEGPCATVVRAIFKKGGVLAVSTRGIGSVVNGIVQENYRFQAIDLVHCPGASDCVVQAIRECEEYMLEYNNRIYAPELKAFNNILEHNIEKSPVLGQALDKILAGKSILQLN